MIKLLILTLVTNSYPQITKPKAIGIGFFVESSPKYFYDKIRTKTVSLILPIPEFHAEVEIFAKIGLIRENLEKKNFTGIQPRVSVFKSTINELVNSLGLILSKVNEIENYVDGYCNPVGWSHVPPCLVNLTNEYGSTDGKLFGDRLEVLQSVVNLPNNTEDITTADEHTYRTYLTVLSKMSDLSIHFLEKTNKYL